MFLVDRLELALFKSSLQTFVLIRIFHLVIYKPVTDTVGCKYAIFLIVYYFSVWLHFCSMGLKFLELDFANHNLNGDCFSSTHLLYFIGEDLMLLLQTPKDE